MASPQTDGQNKASNATLLDLNKPEKLQSVLKKDTDDCLSCRLMGSAAMFGLAGYIFISGRRSLLARGPEIMKKTGSTGTLGIRMMGLGTLSGTFVAMGMYRFIN